MSENTGTTEAVDDLGQPSGLPADTSIDAQATDDTSANAGGSTPTDAESAESAKPAELPRFVDNARDAIAKRYTESQRSADPSLLAARAGTEAMIDEGGDGASARTESSVDGSSVSANGSPHTTPQQREQAGGGDAEESAASSPPNGDTVTVKVYGTELEVPRATVEAAGGVAAYQKQLAVDVQLRRASEITKRLAALESGQNAQASAAPATVTAAASPPVKGERAAASGKEAAPREVLEALLESDPERFSVALKEVVEGTVQERLRAEAGQTRQAAHAAAPASIPLSRTSEEIASANRVFDEEFSHLKGRPEVFQAAQDLMRARMSSPAYAEVPLDMLARDVGARVMKLTGAASGASEAEVAAQPAASNVQDRLALRRTVKARLPASTVSAAAAAAAQAQQSTKSYSQKNSEYIRSLRMRSGSNSVLAERGARR